jgi:hypothetical protein
MFLPRSIAAWTLILLVSAAAIARAALPDDRNKEIVAQRITTPIVIDGRLDEVAWRTARADKRFTQNFPNEGKAPSEETELYLLYDDHALYIGVRCHDREPEKIVERLTRRDRDTDADKVVVDIDSRRDRTGAYHFDLNVAGVLADGVRFNDTDFNGDWDGLWNGVTARDAGGWTAEFEIPWRTLRFAGDNPVMGLQVRRYLQRRQEVDEWAYVPRVVKGEVSRYGAVTGLTGLLPSRLFQLWPYVAMRLTNQTAQGLADGYDISPTAGLDLKLGLTSSLTLDATVNPDFGQVEADQVQLNLTTFEIFFPEKRPFFLEGVDLFGTPIQQFYTRRIGHAPAPPVIVDNQVATEVPTAGQIWGAAKLSGQIIPHLSVAALEAITAERTALVLPSTVVGAKPEVRLLDPLTNYAILRVRSDFGHSYVGFTGTAVDRREDRGTSTEACPNDETPLSTFLQPKNGRCTHDGYSGGLDARLITNDGTWGVAAHGVVSHIENGPTRPIADGTQIGSGDTGYGLSVDAGKQGGEHVLFGVHYNGYTPKLDLNDAGYLARQNVQVIVGGFTLRSTKPIGPALESSWDSYSYNRLSWSGESLWHELGTSLWARWKNFWQCWIGFNWHFAHLENRETRDGALLERPPGPAVDAYVKSDPRKRAWFELNAHYFSVQHGVAWSGDARIALRPLPQIELDVIPRVGWTYGDPRWAFQTDQLDDGSRRYWFGDLDSKSFDVTIRGTYTFTPRLTFQLYAQVFIAGYHYSNFVTEGATGPRPTLTLDGFVHPLHDIGTINDFREGAVNVNAVLRWEYLPGSTLIGVYTRAQTQVPYDPNEGPGAASYRFFKNGPATDVFLLKLSYLWG